MPWAVDHKAKHAAYMREWRRMRREERRRKTSERLQAILLHVEQVIPRNGMEER